MTVGMVRGMAVGLLRMSLEEFYGLRPAELFEALWAYRQERDADRRHIGELVRGATARLININLERCKQITDLAAFWPMPWDEPEDDDEEENRLRGLSEEERAEEIRKFMERWQ